MRLVSIICGRLKSLGLGYGAGIWGAILVVGLGTPVSAAPRQQGLRLAQTTPTNQGEKSQTPDEQQNPPDQPASGPDQGQAQTDSPPSPPSPGEQGDEMLAVIQNALANISSPDLGALGQAFGIVVKKQEESANEPSAVELIELGDLDGDGISEVALEMLVTDASQSDAQGQPPPPSRGLYLLSWDGSRWKASPLASAENFQFKVVRLGKSTGRCIGVVNIMGEEEVPYPSIFQLREHEAAVLWDSQAGDNRYNALDHGRIVFQDNPKLDQTDMVVIGRADPGLLQFEPGGRRGFNASCVYHWDGQAYVPAETEYSPGPDNSLYRFIAALHLHDFRSAYALIDPGKFLKTETPSLEMFRQTMEQNWREFLDDQIFQAREPKADSPDTLAFELPEKHYVYLPRLSTDGKFRLLGLERKVEMPGADSAGDSP